METIEYMLMEGNHEKCIERLIGKKVKIVTKSHGDSMVEREHIIEEVNFPFDLKVNRKITPSVIFSEIIPFVGKYSGIVAIMDLEETILYHNSQILMLYLSTKKDDWRFYGRNRAEIKAYGYFSNI